MEMDYLDPQGAEHMPEMADSAIALDFLLSVKTGIRYYAVALTETSSQVLRQALYRQMEQSIDLYEEVVTLMLEKGWLYPHDVEKQIELDIKSAENALFIGNLNLFPHDTDRLGMMATPNQ